jgi:cytochrome c oxidase subunit IV
MFSRLNPFEKVAPTKASIVRILAILTVITIIEVGFALWLLIWNPEMYESSLTIKWSYRIFMIVMSLGKAFFIVAEFMHMWYETKQFVFYTLITVVLLFWFIVALLWEGDYFLDNRKNLNLYQPIEQVSDQ